MNFADQLMALSTNREAIPSQYRDFYHGSNISITSTSSFSDEDDDSPGDSAFYKSQNQINRELATIFAANQLLSAQERDTSRPPKKNVYAHPQRVKHSSGGSSGGGKKVATAWKRITDKFGKPQQKCEKRPKLGDFDPWRRFSLDAPAINGLQTNGGTEERRDLLSGHHPNLARLQSLERYEDRPREHQATRPRSNSMASHFKILSKHAEIAEFTVTAPSKLADASALCQEYFSRLSCYDAIPVFSSVIAVDKSVPVSRVFNIFCENGATAIIIWDSVISSAVSACHVDDLVCRLWTKARRSGIDQLFDIDGDFSQPLGDLCSTPFLKSVPANTSLMDAARFICTMKDDPLRKRSKRLALANESAKDVVHLLSAWDLLHFFSQQVSKFQAAHTAFDKTLGSILALQPESNRQIEVLTETKPLKDVIGSLVANDGGAVVVRVIVQGKQAVVPLSFLDIIHYVVYAHGSWNEADAAKNTLEQVLRYYPKKESLVFTATTPLFAVLRDWVPSMTADMPVVVVADTSMETVLGVLEPEQLLQALLLDTANTNGENVEEMDTSTNHIPVSTKL